MLFRREDGPREGVRAVARAIGIEMPRGVREDAIRGARVLLEDGEDGLHRDGGLLLVPAVIVGDERHGGIADSGLPAELRLGGVRHADHIDACLLYTSPSPRDRTRSRMPSSA